MATEVFWGILYSGVHLECWKGKTYVRLCDLEEEKEEENEEEGNGQADEESKEIQVPTMARRSLLRKEMGQVGTTRKK